MCDRSAEEIRDEVQRRAVTDERLQFLEEENATLRARIARIETALAVAAGAVLGVAADGDEVAELESAAA